MCEYRVKENTFIYRADLPGGVREIVAPCDDGYTIYVDAGLDEQAAREAYQHAMKHIDGHDFEKNCVQEIEEKAHKK